MEEDRAAMLLPWGRAPQPASPSCSLLPSQQIWETTAEGQKGSAGERNEKREKFCFSQMHFSSSLPSPFLAESVA